MAFFMISRAFIFFFAVLFFFVQARPVYEPPVYPPPVISIPEATAARRGPLSPPPTPQAQRPAFSTLPTIREEEVEEKENPNPPVQPHPVILIPKATPHTRPLSPPLTPQRQRLPFNLPVIPEEEESQSPPKTQTSPNPSTPLPARTPKRNPSQPNSPPNLTADLE